MARVKTYRSTIDSKQGEPMRESTTQPFSGYRALVLTPVPTHPTTHGNRARVLGVIQFLTLLGFDVHVAVLQREIDRDDEAMRCLVSGFI